MKDTFLGILFFLSACASTPNIKGSLYEKAFNFQVGVSTEAEVVKALGIPSSRTLKDEYYVLEYDIPETGIQRLSLNFRNNNKLSSLLWVPSEGEKEITLEGAKASFKGAKFKTVEREDKGSHSISKTILYIDEASGITIRYNPSSNYVEAIAKHDVDSRIPAGQKKK